MKPSVQLAVSSHENATPVKLIHNAAGHLNGPARTIGAAVIGYLGKNSPLEKMSNKTFSKMPRSEERRVGKEC